MFLDMIFRDGFYHADPHPGNLMVLNARSNEHDIHVIGVLDCGMVGRVDESLREDLEQCCATAALAPLTPRLRGLCDRHIDGLVDLSSDSMP